MRQTSLIKVPCYAAERIAKWLAGRSSDGVATNWVFNRSDPKKGF